MLNPHDVLRDRYQLQRKLGQTAGRQTWLALDQANQPSVPVIIKLLAFVDQVNWDTLKLFEREASILQQLDHPAIPQYRDYFSIDDRVLWFGLVQDYIPGSSLSDLIRQGRRFSLEQVQQIAVDLLHILIYLHNLTPPVFHRDIKPSNLILDERDRIFLIDFGAVQDRAAVEGSTFTVVGTYGYAPMEQFGGRTVAASDLYSLGATLIHLLTGVSPADLPQRNLQIQFTDQVNLPVKFTQWLQTLTHPDVSQRFPTAQAALNTLRQTWIVSNPVAQAKPKQVFTPSVSHSPGSSSAIVKRRRRARNIQRAIRSHDSLSQPIAKSDSGYVEITESPELLMIAIANENRPVSSQMAFSGASISCFGVIISIAAHFFVLPAFVVVLITVFVFPAFIVSLVLLITAWELGTATRVVFQQSKFTIFHDPPDWMSKLLGHAFAQRISENRVSTDLISSIQAVIQHNMEFAHGKSHSTHRVVTIQTSTKDYSFGKGLKRDECEWIAQTIRHWIGLR